MKKKTTLYEFNLLKHIYLCNQVCCVFSLPILFSACLLYTQALNVYFDNATHVNYIRVTLLEHTHNYEYWSLKSICWITALYIHVVIMKLISFGTDVNKRQPFVGKILNFKVRDALRV